MPRSMEASVRICGFGVHMGCGYLGLSPGGMSIRRKWR